ncbi:MAG: hypothetical protein ABFC90_11490 [Bacteroidales bacterium]
MPRTYRAFQSQSRSKNKLDFHFNMALTALNVAKVEDRLSIPKERRGAFSMANIKTVKNQQLFKELIYYGTMAA